MADSPVSNPEVLVDLSGLLCVSKDLRGCLPDLVPGRYGCQLIMDSSAYPLARHLCYMRDQGGSDLSTAARCFNHMFFAVEPPGIPVGPWPGWRGIPQMPKVRMQVGSRVYAGRYNFWGDEFETDCCRLFFIIEINRPGEEFTFEWEDERLRPVSLSLYPSAKRHAAAMPVALRADLAAVHPRLLFSEADLADLRRRKEGSHAAIWAEIKALLNNEHLAFSVTSQSKLPNQSEALNEMDRVVLFAFSALLQPDPQSTARAVDAFMTFLRLAAADDYEPMLIDTQAGECLFTLCLGYDWMHPWLPAAEIARVEEALFRLAHKVWLHLGYEREDYSQAHFLGCSHGLLAFSLLFWREHPRAQEWAAYLAGAFQLVAEQLPKDGFYGHGINLWIYEHAFMMRFLELLKQGCAVDFWQTTSYWRRASDFRRASLSPDGRLGITFGDPQYRVAGDAWIHYLIARRTGSATAQALARRLAEGETVGVDFRNAPARRRVWEFLFYDPKVKAAEGQESVVFFQDGGQIFQRSRNAGNETLITCRSGAPLGRERYAHGEWGGYGHSDPCNGAFLICRNRSFLVCGPGPVYRRDTALHNTVTFDGRGQIGDRLPWAPEFIPMDRFSRWIETSNAATSLLMEVELAPAYLDFLGVRSLNRRIFSPQADVFLVHDRIKLEKEREVQWNLHTYAVPQLLTDQPALTFLLTDGRERLRACALSPAAVSWRSGPSEFVPAYPHSGEQDHFIQFYQRARSLEFCVLLDLDNRLVKYNLQKKEDGWRFDFSSGGTDGTLLF